MIMKYSYELLIEYLEGTLSDQKTREIKKWLKDSADARTRVEQLMQLLGSMENSLEYSPDERIDWEFKSKLEEEIDQKKDFFKQNWMRIAAAVALLIVGFAMGTVLPNSGGNGVRLIALQGQVGQLQQLVMMSTLQDHSASERLQVVSLIEDSDIKLNDELISTLVRTMTSDDSPNVRYAAVQALGRFIYSDNVRMEMVRSLEHQTDPLIQISMINLLVQAEERSAIAPMKKIIEKENTSEEVKRQAKIAIDILI